MKATPQNAMMSPTSVTRLFPASLRSHTTIAGRPYQRRGCSSSRTNDHALLSVANVGYWHFSYLVRCPIWSPEWVVQSGHPPTAPNLWVHALNHSCGGSGCVASGSTDGGKPA
jgi:hypothetical protein